MSALDRIERLPDWPARMTAPVAAAYMGVSQSTFLTRFAAIGMKEGGNTLWAKLQLDTIVAQQFNLTPIVAPSAAPAPVDEYEAWKASRKKG
jgi:hypothetical protein